MAGMPWPRSVTTVPGLGARRDVDLLVAVERRHAHGRAERRGRRGHVDDGDEVVAVADEALVLGDAHEHVEVAGRPAALAGVAAAGQADALLVGDAGRHVHVERLAHRLAPAARARRAGLGGHPPLAAADVADLLAHELAERRARDRAQPAGAVAARQVSTSEPGSARLPWQRSQASTRS